jgi:hypothetical protein
LRSCFWHSNANGVQTVLRTEHLLSLGLRLHSWLMSFLWPSGASGSCFLEKVSLSGTISFNWSVLSKLLEGSCGCFQSTVLSAYGGVFGSVPFCPLQGLHELLPSQHGGGVLLLGPVIFSCPLSFKEGSVQCVSVSPASCVGLFPSKLLVHSFLYFLSTLWCIFFLL